VLFLAAHGKHRAHGKDSDFISCRQLCLNRFPLLFFPAPPLLSPRSAAAIATSLSTGAPPRLAPASFSSAGPRPCFSSAGPRLELLLGRPPARTSSAATPCSTSPPPAVPPRPPPAAPPRPPPLQHLLGRPLQQGKL
jgi:hypothetical protein